MYRFLQTKCKFFCILWIETRQINQSIERFISWNQSTPLNYRYRLEVPRLTSDGTLQICHRQPPPPLTSCYQHDCYDNVCAVTRWLLYTIWNVEWPRAASMFVGLKLVLHNNYLFSWLVMGRVEFRWPHISRSVVSRHWAVTTQA